MTALSTEHHCDLSHHSEGSGWGHFCRHCPPSTNTRGPGSQHSDQHGGGSESRPEAVCGEKRPEKPSWRRRRPVVSNKLTRSTLAGWPHAPQAPVLSLRKSVHLHLRPICWKLQNSCHIASWHRSQMFAWKSTDSYIPLGVVIFRCVILHLKAKAALNTCAFPLAGGALAWRAAGAGRLSGRDRAACSAGPTPRPNAACRTKRYLRPWLESRAGPDVCLGTGSLRIYSWRAQPALEINAHHCHACFLGAAGGSASGLEAGRT